MIIFYDKKTGKIQGVINGRIHNEDQLKMWVGNKSDNDRIVVNWKPIKTYMAKVKSKKMVGIKDEGDIRVPIYEDVEREIPVTDYKPDHEQKALFAKLDKDKRKIKEYKVDLKTKQLKKVK